MSLYSKAQLLMSLLRYIALGLLISCGSGSARVAQPSETGNTKTATLSNWFAGGLTGKKLCFVGDSTTSNATVLFNQLGTYTLRGGSLYGIAPILNFGENGASLQAFLSNIVVHGVTSTIAAQADLYVISYGINDVRLGNTTEDQLVSLLIDAVDRIRVGVPNADIVLRVPNSLLTTDVNGYGFVQPNSNAQAYSGILRNAYLRLRNRWSNVVIFDSQELVFGTVSLPSSPLMFDQLHPSSTGYTALANALITVIGYSN